MALDKKRTDSVSERGIVDCRSPLRDGGRSHLQRRSPDLGDFEEHVEWSEMQESTRPRIKMQCSHDSFPQIALLADYCLFGVLAVLRRHCLDSVLQAFHA